MITLHHVTLSWFDRHRPPKNSLFHSYHPLKLPCWWILIKNCYFLYIFSNFDPLCLWQVLNASHGSPIGWSPITMANTAGLMSINPLKISCCTIISLYSCHFVEFKSKIAVFAVLAISANLWPSMETVKPLMEQILVDHLSLCNRLHD